MTDTIYRQAAIDAVKHAWAKGLEPSQYIEALPPAQPQPKIIDDGDAVTILSRNTPYSFYLWAVIADMLKRCGLAFCEREVEHE